MLVNFNKLVKRPYVKDFAHKNSAEMVLKLLKDDIKEVEDTFEISQKKTVLMSISHPKHEFLAILAFSLIIRTNKAKKLLKLFILSQNFLFLRKLLTNTEN